MLLECINHSIVCTLTLVGPPDGGEDSDLELEDDNNMEDNVGLPREIAAEVDVFYEESSSESEDETIPSSEKKRLQCGKTLHLMYCFKKFHE